MNYTLWDKKNTEHS